MSAGPRKSISQMEYEIYDDYDQPTAMETERYDKNGSVSMRENYNEPELDNCWSRFVKGMRSCWATRHTEDTKTDRELYIKTTLRELLIYILFLVVLMILTFGMSQGTQYYYTDIMSKLFKNTKFEDGSSSFAESSTTADFWKFLKGPLMSGLYWDKWYNNQDVPVAEKNFIYYENKLIGVPRLRQIRVSSNSCAIHDDFKKEIKECFAEYAPSVQTKQPFGLKNSTAWNYTEDKILESGTTYGVYATYQGGGYYIDLARSTSESLSIIDDLFKNLWIDRGTRAVFVDFTVYNANINLFCVIKLFGEFPATGGLIPNFEFRTVKLIRYVTPLDYFVLACELIFLVFIIYYIVEETIEIKRHRMEYFLSFWNILDILVILISLVCAVFNVYRTIKVQTVLESLLANENQFPNFDFLSFWQLQFNYAIAITVFFAWVKIFKYISFNKTMTQLNSTLSRCSKDLAGFAVMFSIIFVAFAQLGYLIFGTQVKDFREFHQSVFTLLRIILGDFDFQQLEAAHRVLGPLYFILYVFFVFFVLINMFLAIINDTYSEVKSELATQKNEFEMGDFFKQRANILLTKLHIKKDKINEIQKVMNSADLNNDSHLDFDEWRAELKTRGYAEGEIEAVFSKYDTDGDRVLDEIEQRKMQSELEGQKAALANEISMNKSSLENSMNEDQLNSVRAGVNVDEFRAINRRVEQMETSISAIVSKIDGVLDNLETIEKTKAKRRETMGQILNALTSNEDLTEEERKQKIETLVQDEINKINQDASSTSSKPKSGKRHKNNI